LKTFNGIFNVSDMKSRFKVSIFHTEKRDHLSRFHIHKFKYALFPKDNAVTSSIINGRQYEPYIFDFIIKNNIDLLHSDVVDAGANNGNFTIDFAMLVGDAGRVYAFEPQRIIYYQLCGNVFMNGIDNVICINKALSNISKVVNIQYPNYFHEGQVNFGDVKVISKLGERFEEVEATTLDNYDFVNLKLIKIDVQGYEYNVLKGSIMTIERHRPYIIFELEEEYLNINGHTSNDLLEFFKSVGYVVRQFQKGVKYHTRNGECLDWIAIPEEKFSDSVIIP